MDSYQDTSILSSEERSAASAGLAWHCWILALGTLASLLVLINTARYGAGISYDSTNYITAARSLALGNGLLRYTGGLFVYWPPLYPMLLAGLSRLSGLETVIAGRLLAAFLSGIIAVVAANYAVRLVRYKSIVVPGSLTFAVAAPLTLVSSMIWSEPLFILLALLFLIVLGRYARRPGAQLLALAALLAGLGWLTRYIGVTLLLTGMVVIAAQLKNLGPKRTVAHLLSFAVASSLPIASWFLRNFMLTGTLMGGRLPSQYTLAGNISLAFREIVSWYVPVASVTLANSASLLILLFLGLLAVSLAQSGMARRLLDPDGLSLSLFVAIYLAVLTVSSSITAYDRINDRLLSPIYIPLFLLFLLTVELLVDRFATHFRADRVYAISFVLLGLWLLAPLRVTLLETTLRYQHGAGGYSMQWWHDSATLALVQRQLPDLPRPLFSNAPDVLYILADIKAEMSPQRPVEEHVQPAMVQRLKQTWPPADEVTLIWFNNRQRDYLFAVPELMAVYEMTTVAEFDDGGVYIVRSVADEP